MNLHLSINEKRLLQELPKFFQSFNEALSEVVQNTYRAGAKTLHIDLDYDRRRVMIRDDGPGAASPEAFLTAGQSGWGHDVIDPAGLGLFALMGLAEHMTIESTSRDTGMTWRVTIDEDCFQGKPVAYEETPAVGAPGVTVVASLKPQADLSLHVPGFRHFFPLDVYLTLRSGETVKTFHLTPPKLEVLLKTPVGDLAILADGEPWDDELVVTADTLATFVYPAGEAGQLTRSRRVADLPGPENTSIQPVWEYRVMGNNVALDVLRAIHEMPRGNAFVKMIQGERYFWLIDPGCRVRPKLPDRRELIADEHLRRAREELARAVAEAVCDEGFVSYLQGLDLPDELDTWRDRDRILKLVEASGKLHPLCRPDVQALAELAGYQVIEACRWSGYEIWKSWDGTEWELPGEDKWIRSPWRVPSQDEAAMLYHHGIRAVVGEPNCYVRAVNPRLIEKPIIQDAVFGICDRLEFVSEEDGRVLQTLPWAASIEHEEILRDQDGNVLIGSVFLIAGAPEEALERLGSLREFIGWCFQVEGLLWEWIEEDEDEAWFDDDRFLDDMREIFCEAFLPNLLSLAVRQRDAETASRALGKLKYTARECSMMLRTIQDPAVRRDLEHVERLIRDILDLDIDWSRYEMPGAEG